MIDTHVHAFPDEFIKDRWKLVEKDENFAVIYSLEKSRLADGNEIIEYVESYSTSAVTFGFTWLSNDMNRFHNEFILDLSKRSQSIIPFGIVNIFSKGWKKEVERCLSNGFKGFGEIGYYVGSGHLSREEWNPFMSILEDAGVPLLLHVNESVGHRYPGKADIRLDEIYNFVKRFPKNKIILAHLGGGIFFYELMKEVKKEFRNVYFDTAAAPFLYESSVYRVFQIICGDGKLLFGSDYPLLKPDRYKREIIGEMGEEYWKRITEDNPKALLLP